MHGGTSTGPRTPEGLERCKKGRFRHGLRSVETRTARRQAIAVRRAIRELIAAAARKRGTTMNGKSSFAEYLLPSEWFARWWEPLDLFTTVRAHKSKIPVDVFFCPLRLDPSRVQILFHSIGARVFSRFQTPVWT